MVWQCVVTTKNPAKFLKNNPNLAEMLENGEAFAFDEETQKALQKTPVNMPRMPNEDYGMSVTIVKPGRSAYEQKIKDYHN